MIKACYLQKLGNQNKCVLTENHDVIIPVIRILALCMWR